MRIYHYIILTIVILVAGCCKDKVPANPLEGKLKSYYIEGETFRCTFHYDSETHNLNMVKFDDSITYTIQWLNTNEIILSEYTNTGVDAYFIRRNNYNQITLFDYADNNGQSTGIHYIEPILNVDTLTAINQNAAGFGLVLYKDIENYSFEYLNDNCTSSITTYDYSFLSFPPTYTSYIDTLHFQYNNIPNTNVAIWQNPYTNITAFYRGPFYIDPIYIAQIAGFYITKPNKNMMSSRDFAISGGKITYNLTYQQDAQNRIEAMTVQQVNSSTTGTYRFTYY